MLNTRGQQADPQYSFACPVTLLPVSTLANISFFKKRQWLFSVGAYVFAIVKCGDPFGRLANDS
jgi:hypothetical protein